MLVLIFMCYHIKGMMESEELYENGDLLEIDLDRPDARTVIRDVRKERGYPSGVEFAKELGYSKSKVYRYESGEQPLDLDFTVNSAIVLGFKKIYIKRKGRNYPVYIR